MDGAPDKDRVYEQAQNLYDRVVSWVQKLSTWVGTSGPATLSLKSAIASNGASSSDLKSDNASPGSARTSLHGETSRSAGELSLRRETELSKNTKKPTGAPEQPPSRKQKPVSVSLN